MRPILAFVALAVIALTSPALAGGVDDARRAWQMERDGDATSALYLYTLAIDSGDLGVNDLSYALNNRGRIYMNQGKTKAALADLDRAIKIDSSNDLAYANRCRINEKLGRKAAAIADCRKAVDLNPDDRVEAKERLDKLEGR